MRQLRQLPGRNRGGGHHGTGTEDPLLCGAGGKLLGYSLGRSSYIQILRGSEEKRLLEKGLDQLSTYGILQEPAARLQDYFAALESQGYLEARQEHSTVTTTPLARKVLFQGQTVRMRTRHIPEERLAAHKMQEFGPVDEALFQSLRRVRMAEAGRPASRLMPFSAMPPCGRWQQPDPAPKRSFWRSRAWER